MNIILPLIISSIAGFSTILGCIPIFFNIRSKDKFISFCISFSLSVMLSVSIFDLIPSSLEKLPQNIFLSILIFIIFFGMGSILVKIINKKISYEKEKGSSLYKLGILSMIALILHNFPEGILTFLSSYQDIKLGLTICIVIALHNIPEGISIAIPLYYSTGKRSKAVIATAVSGLAEPLGALLAFIVLKNFITDSMISIFLILVAGIMVTLSIEEMLPVALKYKDRKSVYLGLIIGLLVVIISLIVI